MQTESKPLTPFGVIFHQLKSQNIKLKYAPFFFVGKYAYEEARKSFEQGQPALCLPMNHKLDDYAWPISGLRLILFDTGGMSSLGLSKLAHGLLKRGATVVGVMTELKQRMDVFTFKKDLYNDKDTNKR